MRSLTHSVSGPEGVFIAVLMSWLDSVDLTAEALAAADVPTVVGGTLHDTAVGSRLFGRTGLWRHWQAWIYGRPEVAKVLEKAAGQHGPLVNGTVGPDALKDAVSTELGRALKASAWWREHLPEVEEAIRRGKIVKKVLES